MLRFLSHFSALQRCAALLLGVLLCIASSAQATTRVVTTLSDISNPTDGVLTLREAIGASAAGDTITFAANLGGETIYVLTEFSIGRDLTIIGPAKGIRVHGGNYTRLFNISAGTVRLSNFTISNGIAYGTTGANGTDYDHIDGFPGGDSNGGGIRNVSGIITLTNCTLYSNQAIGGEGGDSADAGSGAFRGGAGGSGTGGGIFNSGTMTLVNCTLSGNSAVGGASGLGDYNGGAGGEGAGGAIASEGPLTLVNCTLSANTASGGNGGSVFGTGGNGGNAIGAGLLLLGSGSTRNSIIAANLATGGNGGDDGDAGGGDGANGSAIGPDVATGAPLQSQGDNLIGVVDENSSGWIASDLLGSLAAPLDPQLLPLQGNGGPTYTMALLSSSAAINAGNDAVLSTISTDARLLPRKQGASVDIGAFEFEAPQSGTTLVVNTVSPHNDGSCGPLDCTFIEAMIASNAGADANTVNFKAGLSGTISIRSVPSGLSILNPVTINGLGARILTISAIEVARVFWIRPGVTANISGLTLTRGNSVGVGSGGAILNEGTLTLLRCAIVNNSGGSGGGVANHSTLNVYNCTFASNQSTGHGGAIRNVGNMEISNSTFWNNTAASSGAITSSGTAAAPASVTLDNCTIAGNRATDTTNGYGGGINNYGESTITLHNMLIGGNTAANGTDVAGTFVSQDYNLIQTFQAAYATFNGPTTNTISNIDPKLDPAGPKNNGGPTDTIALLANSPAINAGGGTQPTADQRGFGRVGALDIGAYEVGPLLSVNNPRSLPEGSAASPGSVTFDITLNAASTQSVTVNYQTANGSNNPALAGSDYTAKSGKLTFLAGETLKRVTISFIGDSAVELNETFFFDLKTPTGATIADNRGVGQINNDDGPGITISNAATIDEGNSGTKPQTFAVTLSAASTNTVTVDWTTADSTAVAADYVAASGTLTFAPGQTSKTITVQVKGDTTVEPTETYKVILSKATYAFIAAGTGIGTIRNDDGAGLLFEDDEPSR